MFDSMRYLLFVCARHNGGRGLVSVLYVVEHKKGNICSYIHSTDDLYMGLVVERNQDKDHGDMTQNPTCVTITRSIFMNKKVLVFTPTRQTA